MIDIYIFESVCGIAILFLLKFMLAVGRELHHFGSAQNIFSRTRGKYVPEEERRSRIAQHQTELRGPAGLLPDLHGRSNRVVSVVTPADRRFGEGGALLRGRAGRFDPGKRGV